MSSNFIKKAFTITELVMSLVVMGIVAIAAINIVFKKEKAPKKFAKDVQNYVYCYKNSDPSKDIRALKYDSSINGCDFDIQKFPEMLNREFFEITLYGADAWHNVDTKGDSYLGEIKRVVYPSLLFPFHADSDNDCESQACNKCESNKSICTECVKGYKLSDGSCYIDFIYRIVLGENGEKAENGGYNGGQTSFLVVKKTSNTPLKILETASGGVVNRYDSVADSTSLDSGSDTDFDSVKGAKAVVKW